MKRGRALTAWRAALFVAAACCTIASGISVHAEEASGQAADCAIQKGPCVQQLATGLEVTLDIFPKPVRSMSELRYAVTVKQKGVRIHDARVVLDLTMPGMFMGMNKVVLKHIHDGKYEGTGVITRCASGRKIWQAEVTVQGPKAKTTARFIFEVQ